MNEKEFPIVAKGITIANEQELLAGEEGLKMNGVSSVRYIVIHCTDTKPTQSYTVEQLKRDHILRGFRTIGYHYYIRRDGTLTQHRRLNEVGAHCRPFNRCSIGICYEGGRGADGRPADTRTTEQRDTMLQLLKSLHRMFPQAEIEGHGSMPGVKKDCPCFDVKPLIIDVIR